MAIPTRRSSALLMAGLAAAMTLPTEGTNAATVSAHPITEIPRSALGNGSRARGGNKGRGLTVEQKRRRRKIALASKRRNRA